MTILIRSAKIISLLCVYLIVGNLLARFLAKPMTDLFIWFVEIIGLKDVNEFWNGLGITAFMVIVIFGGMQFFNWRVLKNKMNDKINWQISSLILYLMMAYWTLIFLSIQLNFNLPNWIIY